VSGARIKRWCRVHPGPDTYAPTLLQIAIALSAIALLTRKKWLPWGDYGASAAGVALAGMGAMHL